MSEIASARLIVHLRLLAAQFSEWREEPANPALIVRDVQVTARVLEQLKGELADTPDEIGFTAHQWSSPSGRVVDFLGAWSHVEIVVGADYVVFVDEPASTLAESLGDRASVVLDAQSINWGTALPDLRMARQAGYDPHRLLDATAGAATGPMAAAFLYDQLGPDPELLRRVEANDQPVQTRELLLMRFSTEDAERLAAVGVQAQVARTLLRLVTQDAPARLTTRIRQTYLENVLLEGREHPVMNPAELIPDPAERKRIAGALAADPSALVKDAARWLDGAPWRREPPGKDPKQSAP